MDIAYVWRDKFSNEALNRPHAEGFHHRFFNDDWWAQVNRHSLGWVCAKNAGDLVGFVNVAWDGALHAFILDTVVADACRHRGLATEMLAICITEARKARCEWLHVDFEGSLRGFYFERCGFAPTNAGLIKLI
jgi:ribosomal protein S18 acetylase RimI-like enzyme